MDVGSNISVACLAEAQQL